MALIEFENLPSTDTALNAENLNNNFNEVKEVVTSTTLSASNWVQNATTDYYEYSIANLNITSLHQVDVFMDIDNQLKMKGNSYTNSYNGGFKIISNKLPTEDIAITYVYKIVENEVAA